MSTPSTKTAIFSGMFQHALDAKKRVTIPARWRSDGIEEIFIVRNPKRACLTALPPDVFQQIGDDAKARAGTAAEHRAFMTQFYSHAASCVIDKHGRLLLPDKHREQAALDTDVVLTGSSDRFEIWSPENWKAREEADRATYENLAEQIGL